MKEFGVFVLFCFVFLLLLACFAISALMRPLRSRLADHLLAATVLMVFTQEHLFSLSFPLKGKGVIKFS